MKRLLLVAATACSLTATAACGGDGGNPDRVLQLSSGAFTERELRGGFQETIADQERYEIICAALGGLSDDQAVEAYAHTYSLQVPDQELVPADEKRFVQILREECEAAYG